MTNPSTIGELPYKGTFVTPPPAAETEILKEQQPAMLTVSTDKDLKTFELKDNKGNQLKMRSDKVEDISCEGEKQTLDTASLESKIKAFVAENVTKKDQHTLEELAKGHAAAEKSIENIAAIKKLASTPLVQELVETLGNAQNVNLTVTFEDSKPSPLTTLCNMAKDKGIISPAK